MTSLVPGDAEHAEYYDKFVKELALGHGVDYVFNVSLGDSDAGQRILTAKPPEQRLFVQAMLKWLNRMPALIFGPATQRVCSALNGLLRRQLPLTQDDVLALLDWNIRCAAYYHDNMALTVKTLERFLENTPLTFELKHKIKHLIAQFRPQPHSADVRNWILSLQELGDFAERKSPLSRGEAWSDAAFEDIHSQPVEQQDAWRNLMEHCLKATAAKPTAAWLKSALPLQEAIGLAAFSANTRHWLGLTDQSRTRPVGTRGIIGHTDYWLMDYTNVDILKGLLWLCAQHEDSELASAMAKAAMAGYRKVPGQGPRSAKLGNASVWALGNMPGLAGIQSLALLKARLKQPSVQKVVAKALAAAAQRVGLPADEIDELTVPSYDLTEVGRRRTTFGEFAAEIRVKGVSTVELNWFSPGDKPRASAPPAVKRSYAAELKALNQAVKDMRAMLPGQRDRLDRLYLEPKQWRLPVWRERYLDHPLIGAVARPLIWKFSRGDQAASGIWWAGQLVGRDGAPLAWLDDQTQVELWHPLQVSSEVVLEWRAWLAQHEIQQPFKQAHREIYLLTDAERRTRVYSNRFAAHILRQHQFNALCVARGWRNQLRLMVDDTYAPPTRLLPAWNLRAEYWVEGAGDEYGRDTNETGTYLYLSTDQVRFYALNAPHNSAHASGGGYTTWGPGDDAANDPLNLADLPPLVFSEVMRDVDLFVGVASVGNDPTWGDRGPETQHINYWRDYAFGALSETAQTRHQLLAGLLPRLKIAARCRLEERFLVVRGDLRTYKIHLGSGNILMEPNDQYLCIVPAQGKAAATAAGQVFLPFEGDQTLAIILSKAFLLAADKAITDPSITRQISRS